MDGLGRFMADNHEAVKVGDLELNMESRPVWRPKFTTDFPDAVVREGADELTLRKEEEGAVRSFIDTTEVGNRGWWATARGLGLARHLPGHSSKGSRDQNGRPRITSR